jgi:hypothetical protein
MNKTIKKRFDDLDSADDRTRLSALNAVLEITEVKVDWVYQVWDPLFEKLGDQNSCQRSIAIMILCNLAKSDHENRLVYSLELLLLHTRDKKFITSRQCIQNIWKVAIVNENYKEKILAQLETRFMECVDEKHYNLIRQDIIQVFRRLYEKHNDDRLSERAQKLIREEKEVKYRKRYEAILNGIG